MWLNSLLVSLNHRSSEKKEDEYVKDFEEARKRIEEFELKTSTKFSCWKTETFLKPGNYFVGLLLSLTWFK